MSYQGNNRNKYRQLLEVNKIKFKGDGSLTFWSHTDTLNVLASRNDDLSFRIVTSESDFIWLVDCLKQTAKQGKPIALDTESKGLDYRIDPLLGVGVCWGYDRETEVQAYIPLVDPEVIKLAHHYLDPLLRSRKYRWVGHNTKYDRNVLRCQWGVIVEFYADTLVGAWVQYPQGGNGEDNPGKARQSYGLKQLANRILGIYPKTFKQIDTENVSAIAKYCCWDARNTLGLYLWLMGVLPSTLINLWLQVESPIANLLSDIEFSGLPVDREALAEILPQTKAKIAELDEYIHSFTDGELPQKDQVIGLCTVGKLVYWQYKSFKSEDYGTVYCGSSSVGKSLEIPLDAQDGQPVEGDTVLGGNQSKTLPPTPLNNPFKIVNEVDRPDAIGKFAHYLSDTLNQSIPKCPITKSINAISDRLAKGKDVELLCLCAPKPCHCSVIKLFCEKKARDKLAAKRKEFNPGSLDDINWLFFEKLKFPVDGLKVTQDGYSLDKKNIATLLSNLTDEQHLRLVVAYVERKDLVKLLGTYLTNLAANVDENSNLIGAVLNQTGTGTGRLSSSGSISIQTLPKNVKSGNPKIRSLFRAKPGYLILDCDYSQMELRILAHNMRVRGDSSFAVRFDNGEDVHRAIASLMFEKPLEEITEEERRAAKNINFGVIYGMGANRLRNMLQMGGIFKSLEWCQEKIDKWWQVLPGAKIYFSELWLSAICLGYVETPVLKRRKYFEPFLHPLCMRLKGKDPYQVAKELDVFDLVAKLTSDRGLGQADMRQLRQAGNAPIQGGNADITKIAMLKLRDLLAGLDCRILTQVHDEIVFASEESLVDYIAPRIQRTMETAYPLSVITPVSLAIAKSWGDCK